MTTLIVHPWEWVSDPGDEPYWRAPGGTAVGLLDKQSNTQASIPGGVPEGAGFFAYPDGAVLPSDTLNLGSDLEAFLNTRQVDELAGYGITVRTSDKIVGAIYKSYLDPVVYAQQR